MFNQRDKRLASEHELLQELVATSDLIQMESFSRRPFFPPEEYIITYHVRSIINIADDQSPIYGNLHRVKIVLPPGYPMTSAPKCFMLTQVWHPNIRFFGEHKGHICINKDVLGAWQTLDMLVEQIGEMLQYKNYHAVNEIPYPEDSEVARWVREYAEPNNIVNKRRGVFTDPQALLKPTDDWIKSRKKKISILIKGVTKQNKDLPTISPDSSPNNPSELAEREKLKRKIVIKKRKI